MEKLFQDFSQVDFSEWLEKIRTDLKGKSEDLLAFKPESDLEVKSYYHREESPTGKFPVQRQHNTWTNRKCYSNTTNTALLSDLNEGVNNLGLPYSSAEDFEALSKDIQFEHITADVRFNSTESAISFDGNASLRLNWDIIGAGLLGGKWTNTLAEFGTFFEKQKQHQKLWVSGVNYAEAGATSIQELAFTLNHLNEYIHTLVEKGCDLQEINGSIIIELGVTEDFFVNVAKFKIINHLVSLVFKGYDENFAFSPVVVYATTSRRFLALNDHNNNLLRQTTMAMSALVGGCDAITIQTLESGNKESDLVHDRMAKNIPLVLQAESYLDKVVDASEGAYYVNQLCEQMLNKSWDLFKEIENEGGLIAAVENGIIQEKIAQNWESVVDNLNAGSRTFLGVNKFPSELEDWKDMAPNISGSDGDFKALSPIRFEEHFKKELHEQS